MAVIQSLHFVNTPEMFDFCPPVIEKRFNGSIYDHFRGCGVRILLKTTARSALKVICLTRPSTPW